MDAHPFRYCVELVPHADCPTHIVLDGYGKGKLVLYSLSNNIRVMTCFNLEGAVLSPQVDRCCDAGDSTFVDLGKRQIRLSVSPLSHAYKFSSLCSSYRKLQVRIFLPVPEEQRELCEETIINLSCGSDGLWVGVPVESSFE